MGERGLNDEHWLEHEINPTPDLHLGPVFMSSSLREDKRKAGKETLPR